MLIKAILADDNKIIRDFFRDNVSWEEHGFELVDVACDGTEGWEKFKKHSPLLVITDVKMPGMDGIELARKIREASPDVIIVFISNYANFEFLKKAMSVRAYDYILKKDIRGKTFDSVLDGIKSAFFKSNIQKRYYAESILFSTMLSGDPQKLEQIFPDRYNVFFIEQANMFPFFREMTGTETAEADIEKFITTVYEFSGEVILTSRIHKYLYVLLTDCRSNAAAFAEKLYTFLYDNMRTQYYIYVLGESVSARQGIAAFHSYRSFFKVKYFERYTHIIRPELYAQKVRNSLDFDSDALIDAVKSNDTKKVCELLDGCTHDIYDHFDYDGLYDLLSRVIDFMVDNSNDSFSVFEPNDDQFWMYADEILFWLKNKVIQFVSTMIRNPLLSYSKPVRKAIIHIKENYMNSSLTVGEIVEISGTSMYLLNKAVKEETGITLKTWLTNIRIEEAKKLLKKQEKISAVCVETGYSNISYFSNVFKKNCGITPMEYRMRNNVDISRSKL